MTEARLKTQINFLLEIDRLKSILRRSILLNGERRENDAEHSWHLALCAIILSEYAKEKINVLRVIKIVLLHDLVEIDAGDTFLYDEEAKKTQKERELKAAERIFNLLPGDQACEFRQLWEEFEARNTPESRFAAALDRIQPLLLNYNTEGRMWRDHQVRHPDVIKRNRHMGEGSRELWEYAKSLIDDALDKKWLRP
jgi:putative hydrolase of HD superfamily